MWSRRLDGPMYRVIYVHDQLLLSHLNSTSRFDTAGNHDWFRFTCHHYATGLFRNVLHSLPTCCRLEASSTTTRGCPDVRACVCVNIFEMVRKQAKQMQGYLLQRFCSDQLGRDGTDRSKTDWLHMQFYGPEMTHGRLQRQSVPRSAVHRDGVQEVA